MPDNQRDLVPGQPFPTSAKVWNPVLRSARRPKKFETRRSSRSKNGDMKLAKTILEILANATGEVAIYDTDGNDTGGRVQAKLAWMHGGQKISADKEILIRKIDGLWVIIGAECESSSSTTPPPTEPDPEPPPETPPPTEPEPV